MSPPSGAEEAADGMAQGGVGSAAASARAVVAGAASSTGAEARSSAATPAGKPASRESLVLYGSMFVMGGCGLAYEYTLSKISSDLLGNSFQQWAIIIGVMMFFMGVGSDAQKNLPDRSLIASFLSAEIILGLAGAFGPILIVESYGRFPDHFVLVQYFFVASIGLLIGFEIPLLTRINERYRREIRLNVGAILKMDYIGALAGALAWVFVLPRFFSTTKMAFVLGILTLLTACAALAFFYRHLVRPRALVVSAGASLALLVAGFAFADRWTTYAEQALYRDRIVHAATSNYQHLVLTRSQAGALSLFINGQLQFNSQDEVLYHESLVHPAMLAAQRRERVLVLGGGDGLAVREVLKHRDVRSVTLCDLDPLMVQLARTLPELVELNRGSLLDARLLTLENHAVSPGPTREVWVPGQHALLPGEEGRVGSVRVINVDALEFVEQVPGQYDVIVLDFPDPNTPELAKLYSRGFYTLLRDRLAVGGVLVQQSTSPFFAKEAYLAIGRTLESAGFATLPYHEFVPSMGDWGFWLASDARFGSSRHLRESVLGSRAPGRPARGSAVQRSPVQRSPVQRSSVERSPVERSPVRGSSAERHADLGKPATNLSLEVPGLRYLNAERFGALFSFGLGQLETDRQRITTMTEATVYRYYVEGWETYF